MDKAKLFRSGRSQAVRLPKEYRFEGEEVFVKRVGEAVVLLPREDSWRTLHESLDSFSDDFMVERNQPVSDPRDEIQLDPPVQPHGFAEVRRKDVFLAG